MTNATSIDVATRDGSQAPSEREPSPQSVLQVFNSEGFKRQVAAALPKHITPESMMRVALTEVRMNKDLQKCTVPSFMGALLKAAQSGLRPGMFGEGWILPRWNSKLSSYEAQFQPGYMGLAQLAYRSGEVMDIQAVAVYKADHFAYQLGSEPKITHVPDLEAEHRDEEIVAFYAVVTLKGGGRLMKVMPRRDVDAIRDQYGPKNRSGKLVGPWTTNYEPMGCKTVLIQCLKLAPKESERLQTALAAESDALFGDKVAGMSVDASAPVSDRVAQRIGAEPEPEPEPEPETDDEPAVDEDTGEVIDGEAEEEASVQKLRPDPATREQLDEIDKARKASGMYDAEFASLIDEYGDYAAEAYGLNAETAGYILEALHERAAS